MSSRTNAKAKESAEDSVVALPRRESAANTDVPSVEAERPTQAGSAEAPATALNAEELKRSPNPAAPTAPTEAAPAPKHKRSFGRTVLLPVFGLAALAAAGWYGYHYWIDGRFMISTDDAYVQADISYVTPKITGYIAKVDAGENQVVKAGDPIYTIDDGDYRIARDQADAQIFVQHKTLDRIQAQIVAAQAALGQSQAQQTSSQAAADNAGRTVDRLTQLVKSRVSTQAQLDDAQTALDQAKASLAGAIAAVSSAEANIGVLQAQLEESKAGIRNLELAKAKAERDLTFTVLRAPYDGVVGNRAAEQGDLVTPGQKLAAVVPLDRVYLSANFKETQLGQLVPGEKVKFTVDALSDETFDGTVSSLSPASGAVFSLLPPENATGNFTKVVQRVPVRIDVSPDAIKSGKLRAGMSVVVDVDSRTAPSSTANASAPAGQNNQSVN